MARVTVEDCLERLDNRFALVLLVSKRTKQLLKGAPPVISSKNNKYIVGALREVAAGVVTFGQGEVEGTIADQVERDLKR